MITTSSVSNFILKNIIKILIAKVIKSVVIDHIFTGPIKIFVYEHAYIISTLNASYLYQPYEKDIKKIASGPLTNIS